MAGEGEAVGFHQEMAPEEEKRRSSADLFRRGSAAEKVERRERRRSTFSEASRGSSSSGPDGGLVWRREPDKVSRITMPTPFPTFTPLPYCLPYIFASCNVFRRAPVLCK